MKTLLCILSVILFISLLLQFAYIERLNEDVTFWHKQSIGWEGQAKENESYADEKIESVSKCQKAYDILNNDLIITQEKNVYLLGRANILTERLKETTDVLEGAIACRYEQGTLSTCVGQDIPALIHENRSTNF